MYNDGMQYGHEWLRIPRKDRIMKKQVRLCENIILGIGYHYLQSIAYVSYAQKDDIIIGVGRPLGYSLHSHDSQHS